MNLQASAARRRPVLAKLSIFQIFEKVNVTVQLGRCKFIFRFDTGIRSDVLGLQRKITESSNEFTDFKHFEFKGVARPKTRDAMQADNHPGVGITLETTALRVT